jgi:phosphate transport system protein
MNTHYEDRMRADLDKIRAKLRKTSDLVENQVRNAVQALLTDDRQLARAVILGDRQVNRRIKDQDYLCHAFIVRHAPSAGHLRFAAAVLRLDVALERVGDYAGSIGREVVRLVDPLPGSVRRDIELIARQSRHALGQAVKAFHDGDVELARETIGLADQTDFTLQTVFAELLAAGEKRELPLRDIFGLLRIINLIRRVAEQSENVCEQTIFAVTGETKDPRIFRILFVDERNDRASQIAEAYARKVYPESGKYESAGWNPARELAPELCTFLDRHGVDVRSSKPTALRPVGDGPEHFHAIVSMIGGAQNHLGAIPFRTTLLEWDLGEDDGQDITEEALKRLYKEVVVRVQELLTTLAGPDAR